jgi:hypothetical protein
MAKGYYTYHIRIDNLEDINIEKYDPAGNDQGKLRGAFSYTKQEARLQELHRSAFADELGEDGVKELGELLFEALFDTRLRYDFFKLYETALSANHDLRITLNIDEKKLPQVAALPWEFLRTPGSNDYGSEVIFSTNPHIVFTRQRSWWTPAAPIQIPPGEPIRITVVAAAPKSTDELKLGSIQFEKAWEELNVVADNNDRIKIELFRDATVKKIDDALKQRPHIFHFIGHGRLHDTNGQEVGEIILSDGIQNNPKFVSAKQFNELFNRHRPSVVLLHTCEGAALSTSQAFAGIASQIAGQNIPVIVAMQFEISNYAARKFAETFYRSLSNGEPVDQAVQEGRRQLALGQEGYNTRTFATPVLFMRLNDGQLYHIEEKITELINKASSDRISEDGQIYREKLFSIFDRIIALFGSIQAAFARREIPRRDAYELAVLVDRADDLFRLIMPEDPGLAKKFKRRLNKIAQLMRETDYLLDGVERKGTYKMLDKFIGDNISSYPEGADQKYKALGEEMERAAGELLAFRLTV